MSWNTSSNSGGSHRAPLPCGSRDFIEEALEEAVPSRNTSLWLIGFVKWLGSLLHRRLMGFNAALKYALMLRWEGGEKRKRINNALRHPC